MQVMHQNHRINTPGTDMATTKPRITVTLTKRQHEVISTIAQMGGGSMSAFIGEMLESALPTLERMAATFQKVKQAQDRERSRIIETMDRAQAALEPVVMEAVGQFDLFLGKVEEAAGAADDGKRSAAAAVPADPLAPATNRGATPTRAKSQKPGQPRVSGVLKKSGFSKCTCTQTAYERQEDKGCPVHFPKGRGHAV
jgi:uncharacterized protein (DUF1778 family)